MVSGWKALLCHSTAIFYLLCVFTGLAKTASATVGRGRLCGGGVARALANQHGLILQGERGTRPDFERCQDLRVQMTDSLLPQQAVDLF
jgi:hypothetical protein